MWKRLALASFGAVMFLVGAFFTGVLASPGIAEAEAEERALRVLCERFKKSVASQLETVQRVRDENTGNDKPIGWIAYSEARSLSALKRVACGDDAR